MDLLATLRQCTTLPTMPGVVMQVVNLAERVDVELNDIEAVIMRDPALAARIVRMANSALYSGHIKVTTVRDAVIRIGLAEIVTVCLQFGYSSMVENNPPINRGIANCWQRGLLASYSGRVIGGFLQRQNLGELQLAALLQDVGVMALHAALPHDYEPVLRRGATSHQGLLEAERDILGMDHAAVGAWLLEEWGIPDKIIEAVRQSHADDDEDTSEFNRAVALAGYLADMMLSTNPEEALRRNRQALDWLEARVCQHSPGRQFGTFLDQLIMGMAQVLDDVIALHGQNFLSSGAFEGLSGRVSELLMTRLLALHPQVNPSATGLTRAPADDARGLFTQAELKDFLNFHLYRVRSGAYPLSLMTADVKITDPGAHSGTQAFVDGVAASMRATFRSSDPIFESANQVFVVVLPGVTPETAARLKQRLVNNIKQAAAKVAVPDSGPPVGCKVSHLCVDHETLDDEDAEALLGALANTSSQREIWAGQPRVDRRAPQQGDWVSDVPEAGFNKPANGGSE